MSQTLGISKIIGLVLLLAPALRIPLRNKSVQIFLHIKIVGSMFLGLGSALLPYYSSLQTHSELEDNLVVVVSVTVENKHRHSGRKNQEKHQKCFSHIEHHLARGLRETMQPSGQCLIRSTGFKSLLDHGKSLKKKLFEHHTYLENPFIFSANTDSS